MQKLLIADSSEIFTSALAAALQDQFQVITCADGKTAQDLLQEYKPEILILNLMLPYVDGLTLLQKSTFHPAVIMAITNHLSAYIEQTVTALGIDYTMITPSVDTVVRRLQDLQQRYAVPDSHADPLAKTLHHLRLLNFHNHLDGYRQLCIGLPMFVANPQQLLTKELYPAVAKQFGCKDGRSVEHSIRNAIYAAWLQRDNAIWRKYFPPGPQGKILCPTNKEFICRLAEMLNTHD